MLKLKLSCRGEVKEFVVPIAKKDIFDFAKELSALTEKYSIGVAGFDGGAYLFETLHGTALTEEGDLDYDGGEYHIKLYDHLEFVDE